jgi:hypothetical protein
MPDAEPVAADLAEPARMTRAVERTHLGVRCVGLVLLVFSVVPVFRVLELSEESPFRQASMEVAEATFGYMLFGLLTVLLAGVLLAFLFPRRRLVRALRRVGERLVSADHRRLAVLLGLWGSLTATAIHRLIYRGFYTNVDEIASAIHARYLALGEVAGPLPTSAAAWLIPNMLTVDAGWVSQFPPSHLVLMAVGFKTHAAAWIGPVLFGLYSALTALVLPRVLPDRPVAASLSAIAVAGSPFLLFIGAGSLSHTSAGAFTLLALYAALRARDGHAAWAALAGAAIGVAVSSRPWAGLVLGIIATAGVWIPAVGSMGSRPLAERMRWLCTRAGATGLGGMPFALALAAYNRRTFGSPTTLGYLAAFGERHKLGFHQDPWGQSYTVRDAIGFTSTDLLSFGTQLWETPAPAGAVIGLWLLAARSLPRGTRFLLAWATLPVVANGFYWFHSTRMLYEAGPAWVALSVLAVGSLIRPTETEVDAASRERDASAQLLSRARRLDLRETLLWSCAASLAIALALGIPDRAKTFMWSSDTLDRVTVPRIPLPEPALVFVHTSWNERLSARLQADAGIRQDSVISFLRRNTNCALEEYATARADDRAYFPPIDREQKAGAPPDVLQRAAAGGTTVRTRQGEAYTAACLRELNADRFGAVSLAPLLWQGSLPGDEDDRPLFVRDLGPQRNRDALMAWPARTPWVFVPKEDGGAPELVPYAEAMDVLWGDVPLSSGSPRPDGPAR